MQVLVVDDTWSNRKLLKAVLEHDGHSIIEAADGLDALNLLECEQVDAIVSDILMPRMDGYRFCHAVRNNARFNHLPFIICSSTYTSAADENLALRSGADFYFRKPAPAAELLEALSRYSGKERPSPTRRAPQVEEHVVMKEYNQVLVAKLEQKNLELEGSQTALRNATECLEARVKERTAELQAANVELDAFNHSVSHDLRNHLTEVYAMAQMLEMQHAESTDSDTRYCIQSIIRASRRMESLTKELLRLSSVTHAELKREKCDLSSIAAEIAMGLQAAQPGRTAEFRIAPNMAANADEPLVQIALENLLSNAWKFTGRCEKPSIEVGQLRKGETILFFIRDNGVGFNMTAASKLFRPFGRLHSKNEFPGTGIGLTLVQRIIAKHRGSICAESEPGKGATFYFTLSPSGSE